MILTLIFTVILLYYLQHAFFYAKNAYRQYTYLRNFPGPPAKFPTGNVLDFGTNSFESTTVLLRWADEARAQGHNIMRVWIGLRPVVLPLNGEALKPILDSATELTKGEDYNFFISWLGLGLLLSTNEKWKSRRRMLTPTFHFAMLDGYVEKMDRHTQILLDILDGKVGKELDIYPFVKRCALDIICDTAMGTELDSQHDPDNPYVFAVGDFNELARDYMLTWYYWLAPVWFFTQRTRKMRLLDTLTTFTKKVIADRIEQHRTGELKFDDTNGKRKAFLDMLIEMKEANALTDEDIREEVDTFMFEGHDTTSSGIGWTLWCLATNPAAQEKACDEVHAVFGDSDRSIAVEDLKGMPYLEKVIKETLRIFPAVPQIQRKVQNDFKIGECTVPGGTDLMLAPYLVHRNEQVYPDRWSFDPERFNADLASTRHAYDYVPFSAGPRNCIGQRFAMYEEKLVVAWILRRFSLHTDRPMLSNMGGAETVLRPSLGVPVTLRRRQ
ncbi:hypothetical protein PFISCL1PPCAC_22945 [Pristionchus fissidentatus]|uniref:Cytochrome P450 n=1 Tax=Pristionchus fissidentatus TaxID=1538716 RepID=A0AAV5WN06_9BILA|nr:hypothetical protein PFISCL1PPCAC_22945 [Pristionchus fissidentatus]